MRMRKGIAVALGIAVFGLAQIDSQENSGQEPSTYEATRRRCNEKIAQARQIGLQRDRSRSKFLLEILNSPPCMIESAVVSFGFDAPRQFHLEVAALVALARLGDVHVLPSLIQLGEKGWHNHPFYRVALARLQVEVAYPSPLTPERWKQKVQRYYDLVGLTKAQLATYLRSEADKEFPANPPKLERIALRHLTEMVANAYQERLPNAFEPLEGLDYEKDFPSALRIQLARLPASQRVAWLINRISQREVINHHAYYEMQALIDYGSEAVQPILTALEQGQGISRGLLLTVLCAIEYSKGCPSLRSFAEGSDPALAQQAAYLIKFPVIIRASDW
jgi:hypothetical protein